MLEVSGVELVEAACACGIVGAFPVANAGRIDVLYEWLALFAQRALENPARGPFCPNLIMSHEWLAQQVEAVIAHRPELVITSVGSPASVVGPLHEVGTAVLADVATLEHAGKAIAAGADGLVLLTAGAGGQTGWMNAFAFVRAVRRDFDGILVLAGGVTDGPSLRAAEALGVDFAYLGTRLIATDESMASDTYKDLVMNSTMDDVLLTRAFTGLPTSMLRPSIEAAGLGPAVLDESISGEDARAIFGRDGTGPRRWADVVSAGHSVSGVNHREPLACVIAELESDWCEPVIRTRKGMSR